MNSLPRFLLRRAFSIVVICSLIIFFIFLGMRMSSHSSGQIRDYNFGRDSTQAISDARSFLRELFARELGMARIGPRAPAMITDLVREAYVNSMGLLLIALAGSTSIGLAIGSFLAITRYQKFVLPLLTLTLVGISIPSFFAGILLQRAEILYLQTFGHQLVKIVGFGWDFEHMFLPVLVLAARPLAYITRATYLSLSQIMQEEFIRTAYAKGLSRRRTINVHAVRNIIVPVLTAIGVSFRFSLGSLPVVELFFLWPGLGFSVLQAINTRQVTLVAALALALGLTILLLNFALDLIYRIADPRMRELE